MDPIPGHLKGLSSGLHREMRKGHFSGRLRLYNHPSSNTELNQSLVNLTSTQGLQKPSQTKSIRLIQLSESIDSHVQPY